MAQKDIQELAEYMESLEQENINYDKACEEASKEAAEALQEEIDSFEDEVIDKTALGFIDDSDTNEADDFYMEDDKDTFEEDVSDCLESNTELVDESASTGSIQIEVFNDDGYGEHFTKSLMQAVPTVNAQQSKKLAPNGDLIVKISGDVDSLRKAFAFWTGNKDFNDLSIDDKELFDSLLVFDNGDTLAEADYREAVAHCLDPIDVKASTANLIGKDSCALSIVKEEKARRSATKMLKALKESDFSSLSDKDLNMLDNIQTAIKNGDEYVDLDPEERRILELVVSGLGYTVDRWLKLSPEQQDKVFKKYIEKTKLSPTGFSDVQSREKPDGKTEYYRNAYSIYDPDSDSNQMVAFNPYYTSDDSVYQHPSKANRDAKKRRAAEEQKEREKRAKEAMKNARGKSTWAISEFAQMIQGLSTKQRKSLMKAMIQDVEEENTDSATAGNEIALIKTMFGKKLTSNDYGKMWNRSHKGVQDAAFNIEGDLYEVARNMTGMTNGLEALGKIIMDKRMHEKFAKEFEDHLNSKRISSRNPIDPERDERRRAYKAKLASQNN